VEPKRLLVPSRSYLDSSVRMTCQVFHQWSHVCALTHCPSCPSCCDLFYLSGIFIAFIFMLTVGLAAIGQNLAASLNQWVPVFALAQFVCLQAMMMIWSVNIEQPEKIARACCYLSELLSDSRCCAFFVCVCSCTYHFP
jgi:hypothetical protein